MLLSSFLKIKAKTIKWVYHFNKKKFLCSVSNDSEAQCSVDASGQHWTCSSGQSNISCSVDSSGHGILCADQQHCPYAEERARIHVTVYLRSKHFLVENYSQHFYLSEIGEMSLRLGHVFIFLSGAVFSFICLSFFIFLPLFWSWPIFWFHS